MQVEQRRWSENQGWQCETQALQGPPNLIILFGNRHILERHPEAWQELHDKYTDAHLIGCSTSGEILHTSIHDDSLAAALVRFDATRLRSAAVSLDDHDDSRLAGRALAQALAGDDLVSLFVLSEGLNVNGSELVRGVSEVVPENVVLTGGLSGDGDRFERTCVIHNREAVVNGIVAVGFYGDRLRIGHGSLGGWDPFGPERLITRAEGNVLYELDNQSALGLYKRYLGDYADGLPATGLLFPLSLRTDAPDHAVVRTILAVDEETQSMTFAGDMPEGSYARLMKANFDRLIDGAEAAAMQCRPIADDTAVDLAILISCVGRRMVLKQRAEEEVESVRQVLGEHAPLMGFYSYGEISPLNPSARCELHNQTMTITTFHEID